MKVLETLNLSKSYGEISALTNVSLSVKKGEVFGLIGPNGAGKSTFVKIISGQLKPDNGSVKLFDIDVVKNPVRARSRIGVVPEQEVPPSFLTSEEYLRFVSNVRGLKNSKKDIDHWFDFLEFESEKDKLSKDLSRGTRQKLMISQAFFFSPGLVIIDEPLVNLDPLIQRKVKDFIKDYVKKGNTVFLCTHVLSMAEELCDRIGFLKNGDLVSTSSVKDLVKKYDSLEKAFIEIEG